MSGCRCYSYGAIGWYVVPHAYPGTTAWVPDIRSTLLKGVCPGGDGELRY